MEHIKELLVNKIEQQAHFRREKSLQYPDDKRDSRSAERLEELKKYVEALPADHFLFQAFQNHDETESEDFEYYLSKYGWYHPQDPKVFVDSVITKELSSFVRGLKALLRDAKKQQENKKQILNILHMEIDMLVDPDIEIKENPSPGPLAADHLKELCDHIESLPADHELFRVFTIENKNKFIKYLHRYANDKEWSLDSFMSWVIQILRMPEDQTA